MRGWQQNCHDLVDGQCVFCSSQEQDFIALHFALLLLTTACIAKEKVWGKSLVRLKVRVMVWKFRSILSTIWSIVRFGSVLGTEVQRSSLPFNTKPAVEQAAHFFCRRFFQTMQVPRH